MPEDHPGAVEKLARVRDFVVVGKRVKRVDSLDKVLGKPIYTGDLIPAGYLHIKLVRSKYPHALIKSVDASRARQFPRVVSVLTAGDVPGINEATVLLPDRPLLAYDKVRCIADPIVAVVAEDPLVAEEAAELVKVEYEPLPAVYSPLDAMKSDAPKIHDSGNLAKMRQVIKGDISKGFDEADVVIENTYSTPFQEQVPLEVECGFAVPERDGSVTCVGSMQFPHGTQTAIAKILGLNPDKVRVIQAATGGAFGPKSDESPIDTCGMAALAAYKTRRPSALVYTREESIVVHTKRHPFIIKSKTGATKDGKLTASENYLYADTGGYASLGPLVIIRAVNHVTGPYVIPHVKSVAYCVYTNNTMCGSFRGFGGPQSLYAAECQMDELAKKLGMDPLDLRLKNILRPGTRTANNQLVDEACGLEDCVIKASEAVDWRAKRAEYDSLRGTKRRGLGIALMYHGNSLGPEGNDYATVHIDIAQDGVVNFRTALTEYGTGAPSGLVQIAAEVLGVRMEQIRLSSPDTSNCADSGPTVASRTIVIGGRATQVACEKLRSKLDRVTADLLECSPEEVQIANGIAYSGKDKQKSISFNDLVEECYRRRVTLSETGYFMAPRVSYEEETSQGDMYLQYTYGAVVAEVQVDTELGYVDVLKFVTAYDAGKAINPLSLEGQIEGGTIQGMGYAIMEDLVHWNGVPMNNELCNYLIPTSMDVPEIKNIIVEYPGALGPWGAKAMGEPPIDLPAPAIANAIAHALGARIFDIPITPEKIVLTLKKLRAH